MANDARAVLVAPDSFKGTFRSSEVAAALGRGLESVVAAAPDLMPVADGGEGTLEVLLLALGGETVGAEASDALLLPIKAGFGLVEDGSTAIVETAQAIGLPQIEESERDAEAASSFGAGQLIAAAAQSGASRVVVAVGGSASSDGGAGALEAIEQAGGIGEAELVVCCDVNTPFEKAAEIFGPQKGADPAAVERLTARLNELAAELPRDPRGVEMTGCAGGLSGALWARHGAALEPGARFVLSALNADDRIKAARAVIVGEGRLDRTTLEGKIAAEIAVRARQLGVPCHAVVGSNGLEPIDQRILDIQAVIEATTLEEIEQAGREIAAYL
jgi:glycerate 2-kinase